MTQCKRPNPSNSPCWRPGSLLSIVLMVAESMHFQLKSNNMTGALDCKEKCLSSSEQHTWGQASSFFHLPAAAAQSSPNRNTKERSGFLGGQEGLLRFLNISPALWGFMTCISGPPLFASIASNCSLHPN